MAEMVKRVDRRKIEFRKRVLEAAGSLFDERGVEATKLDDICAAADVSKRTLCNHFPTKGDIVRALAADAAHSQVALIDSARQMGTTTRQRLEIFFGRLRALPSVHIADHQRELLGEFFRGGSEARRTGGAHSIRMSAAVVELLEAGAPSELPAGCSPETFAEVIVGTIYAITLEWIRQENYDVDAHLAAASKFLVGLLRN